MLCKNYAKMRVFISIQLRFAESGAESGYVQPKLRLNFSVSFLEEM